LQPDARARERISRFRVDDAAFDDRGSGRRRRRAIARRRRLCVDTKNAEAAKKPRQNYSFAVCAVFAFHVNRNSVNEDAQA